MYTLCVCVCVAFAAGRERSSEEELLWLDCTRIAGEVSSDAKQEKKMEAPLLKVVNASGLKARWKFLCHPQLSGKILTIIGYKCVSL